MHRRNFVAASVAVALLAVAGSSPGQDAAPPPVQPITVRVSDMHCATCAKKIARKLYSVAGVVKVRTDLKKHTAYITPQAQKTPSARALWEAVEKAGFQPVALAGPWGKFAEKPEA